MTERRLDVGESRRAFGDGTMKDTPRVTLDPAAWTVPVPDWPAMRGAMRREVERRERLARWQVPRV